MESNLKELGSKIINFIGESDIESMKIVIDGVTYTYKEVYDDGWEDEGKYSTNYKVYQIGIIGDTKTWEISEWLDLFLLQGVTRCGSYFSDYDYQIEKIIVVNEWVSIDE